jgi:RHS repeat-associated protein
VNTYDADYEYDGNGRLTKLLDWIDAIDGLEYAYDAAGRLTQLTDYDGSTLDYAYDAAGRVTSMNDYFSHATTYTYTDIGQVSTITAPGSKVWTYAYNALGQPTSVGIPNGMTTEYGYDTRNRLTAIEHKDGATVLDGFTYALDDGGNITRTTQADSSLWDYEYDGRDRLTKAERYDTDGTTLLHRYSYTYDTGDNILTKLVYDGTNTVTTSYAVNNANEMTSMSVGGTTTTFAYDALGRTTSKTDGTYSATYTYGPPGMLSTVTTDFPDEDNATYVTGGDTFRRSRTVNGTETWYNMEGFSVINEENSNGTLSRTYFGHTAAHVDGTSPSTGDYEYYFHDHLGSTRRLYTQAKTESAAYEYTPYGGEYSYAGTSTTTARLFTGHALDSSTGQYFTALRNYSPYLARWTTRDPFGMVDGPNVYQYAVGNPTSMIDRFGAGHGRPGPAPGYPRPPRPREHLVFTGSFPYQHCVNSCVLARGIGRLLSKIIMDVGKESVDVVVGGLGGHRGYANSALQCSDWRDNKTGRQCAKKKNRHMSCERCCQHFGVYPDTPDGDAQRPYGPLRRLGWWGNPDSPPYRPSDCDCPSD